MGLWGPRLPAFEVLQVRLMVATDLVDAVTAELLEEGVHEHDGHHRFPDHARGGYRTDVAALDHRFHRFPGVEIDGPERLPEGRDRLHGGADHHRLAVGDAAFEPARAVGATMEPGFLVEQDLVVDLRSRAARGLEAQPDLGTLDRMDRAECAREKPVELPVPLHVGSEADRAAERDHLEDSSQRVAG